jgi:hypothetical protein
MVRRCNLAEVEGDGVASLCVDLCEIVLWPMRVPLSMGRPWWLYICSQLGFISNFCLLLQVEVLGLAGFGYPSSGLLPWQEPDRQISRTEGSYPRHSYFLGFYIIFRFALPQIISVLRHCNSSYSLS